MALKEYTLDTFTASSVEHSMCRVRPDRRVPNQARPIFLFIGQDDTGFGQLGCYGAPIKTPDLAQLAVRSRSSVEPDPIVSGAPDAVGPGAYHVVSEGRVAARLQGSPGR